ncbi:MAG TPA: DUF3489 domain-containing protein [Methylibium sp.]|uniref:DUF3489 domain-containing protein n=1 Tax=Methylibium sp. TaxID=2067992 RepID=UPI002DB766BB|nr:DUF3489 domain-containing protein [Methylibium sp.]HEU4458525.1 DUF3489 domain-containing protein [Methylibium sp.]
MPTTKSVRSQRAKATKAPAKRNSRPAPSPAHRSPKARSSTRKASPAPRKPQPSSSTGSKQARLIALLRGASGATVTQMTDLTGWQPHSVRGVISGVLRKKLGLTVSCAADDGGSRIYRIVDAA